MSRHKKETTNPNIIKLKIFFLITLIAAGFLMTRFIKKPSLTMAANTPLKQVKFNAVNLKDVQKMVSNINFDSAKKKAIDFKNQVLGLSDSLLQQKASDAGAIATDFVFDNAINPILDQIHKLPADQQTRLRKQICQ